MGKTFNDRSVFCCGFAVICIYLSPLLIFGENSLVEIHDSLDLFHPILKILAEDGWMFASNNSYVPNLLNGVPRSTLGSDFNVELWLFHLLGPYYGLAFNKIFIHLIAFVGMHRLLKNHFMAGSHPLIVVGVATSFGLLPFYPDLGCTISGQPLVLDAFLTIRKNKSKWTDWAFICLMPLYASFAHAFIFLLTFLGVIWLFDIIIKKENQLEFLFAISLMTLLFIAVEYRVLYAMFFDKEFVSVRTDFQPTTLITSFLLSVHKTLTSGINYFSLGFYYARGLQTFFILPAVIIGIYLVIDRKLKDKSLIYLIILMAVMCMSHAAIKTFWSWEGLQSTIDQFSILRTFRFHRFSFLYPLLWYIIFGLSLKLILDQSQRGLKICSMLLMLQMGYAFYHHDEIQQRNNKPTYKEFYAKKQFSAIEDFIGESQDSYKVVSIGIHPSIALYNGFYTLDGYSFNYPLKYKFAFRKLIEKELEKNATSKAYFDKYGGRCYVFAGELGFSDWIYRKERNVSINNLELNMEAFKELGGDYIFSAVKIKNHEENQLEFLKVFESEESAWRIFLYQPFQGKPDHKI